MDWLEVRDTFAAFLTPVIGLATLFIAYQQWRIERVKFKFDRYEKRLKVYEELRRFLSVAQQEAKIDLESLFRFRANTSEADFLFGADIQSYLNDVYQNGIQLSQAASEYRDSSQEIPDGYDHAEVVRRKHSALTWLTTQFEPAKLKFKPYLDVSR